MKKYHYTYWLSSAPNENYIGVRSCKCKPEDDTDYMSSSKIVKDMIDAGRKFHKIILKVWPTRKAAMEHEILMHSVLDVGRNPLFLNKARATSTGFDTTGKNFSDEHKAKISAKLKGQKHSEATKAKMSVANKGKFTGDKHHMYGQKHSEATKAKISAKLKGQKISAEHKAKISTANTGQKISAETKAKMSAAHTGKKISAETKAKISAANKGRNFSDEHKAKISAAKTGDKHPQAQTVYDNYTGTSYPTVKAAVEATGCTYSYIRFHTERFIYKRAKHKKNSK